MLLEWRKISAFPDPGPGDPGNRGNSEVSSVGVPAGQNFRPGKLIADDQNHGHAGKDREQGLYEDLVVSSKKGKTSTR